MSRFWIIAYDIADDRRRRRVADRLGETAERVQESVFEGWFAAAEAKRLAQELRALIDEAEDAIRFYPLGAAEPARRQAFGEMPRAEPTPTHWIV